jgi:hypothetical protein
MESGPKETTAVEQPKQGVANPLAFPFDENDKGMSLRDYFAAKALCGLLSDSTIGMTDERAAAFSYKMADAMLKARLE